MYKIMIIEDDETIRNVLKQSLSKWSFQVLCSENFQEVLMDFSAFLPDLILMDINLPYFDGFYWCNKIRSISKVPIIFISSRNSNMDIIMAINMGGDDFIQKPFSVDVLMAKINGIIRRTYSYSNVEALIIEHNGLVLNLKNSTLLYENQKLELSKNEFKILYLLLKNNGIVISRDKLMRALWEDESFVDDSTLTVNINRLRKKLEDINLSDIIQTKKGQGYIIP